MAIDTKEFGTEWKRVVERCQSIGRFIPSVYQLLWMFEQRNQHYQDMIQFNVENIELIQKWETLAREAMAENKRLSRLYDETCEKHLQAIDLSISRLEEIGKLKEEVITLRLGHEAIIQRTRSMGHSEYCEIGDPDEAVTEETFADCCCPLADRYLSEKSLKNLTSTGTSP